VGGGTGVGTVVGTAPVDEPSDEPGDQVGGPGWNTPSPESVGLGVTGSESEVVTPSSLARIEMVDTSAPASR
jgi:hypothetical protein